MNSINKKSFKYYNYYRLKIDCIGQLQFDTFSDFDDEENEEKNQIFYAYDNAENKHRGAKKQVEGLVYSDVDNIHVILLTKEKTVPNVTALMTTLKATDGNEQVSKAVLSKAINEFEVEYPEFIERASIWRCKLLDVGDVMTKKEAKVLLNMRSDAASAFNRYLHETYGIWIDGELRKREFDFIYQLSNFVNIKYEYDENDFIDGQAFVYYVGAKSQIRTKYAKACCIRKVITLGDNLEFKELLPLMAVEFVRNSQYTVIPFPYKYLREYILMNTVVE